MMSNGSPAPFSSSSPNAATATATAAEQQQPLAHSAVDSNEQSLKRPEVVAEPIIQQSEQSVEHTTATSIESPYYNIRNSDDMREQERSFDSPESVEQREDIQQERGTIHQESMESIESERMKLEIQSEKSEVEISEVQSEKSEVEISEVEKSEIEISEVEKSEVEISEVEISEVENPEIQISEVQSAKSEVEKSEIEISEVQSAKSEVLSEKSELQKSEVESEKSEAESEKPEVKEVQQEVQQEMQQEVQQEVQQEMQQEVQQQVQVQEVQMQEVQVQEQQMQEVQVQEQEMQVQEPESQGRMPMHQQKYCLSMVRSLKKTKDAGPFARPVDTVKLNIPNYYAIITNPMDLSTIEKKLTNGEYANTAQFEADFRTIIQNCVTFNGRENPVTLMANNLEATFDKQLKRLPPTVLPPKPVPVVAPASTATATATATTSTPKDKRATPGANRSSVTTNGPQSTRPKRDIHPPPPKDLPWHSIGKPKLRKKDAADLRFANNMVRDFQRKVYEPYVYPFVHRVDAVALNIPDYFKVVKTPMELSTVENKLRQNEYKTADEFEHDMNLIFSNCFKYNPTGTPVNSMGAQFKSLFVEKWAERPSLQRERRASLEEDESEEGESESESEATSEDSDMDPGMSLLQKQMALLQQQMEEIAKRKKRKMSHHEGRKSLSKAGPSKLKKSKKSSDSLRRLSSGSKAKPGSSSKLNRKPSGSSKKPPTLTRDQKTELSEMMQNLDGSKIDGVLEIIKETEKIDGKDDEIELDMDTMDPKTAYKLYRYVAKGESINRILGSRKASASSPPHQKKSSATNKRRSEALSGAQAAKKMKMIEDKLGLYEDTPAKRSDESDSGSGDGSDAESEVSEASD